MTIKPSANPWLRFHQPNPNACMRLFCFPYAGGGASIYHEWTRGLSPLIDVCPVQLPAREERLNERPYTRVEPLVEALIAALSPYLDIPFALFGHSMGAIIAYEIAWWLRMMRKGPVHLLVSAQRAPHIPLNREPCYRLPDREFKDKLRELNGTPELVLQNTELMMLMMPALRGDFELAETYHQPKRTPLDCSVSAFGGLADKEVSRGDLEAWSQVTMRSFRFRIFPGDHFYLHKASEALMAAVADCLSEHAS